MRFRVWSSVGCATLGFAFACACDATPSATPSAGDAGDSGALPDSSPATDVADVARDAGPVLSITVSPPPLMPSFSPAIHDYYVQCAAGMNALDVVVKDALGSHSNVVSVAEDQAVTVRGAYWIRCLPHDFPLLTVTPHPEAGIPTPGYYLIDGPKYAIVLDTNGTPVWYARGQTVLDVDSFAPDTISFVPNMSGTFGVSLATDIQIHLLDSATVTTTAAVASPTDGHEFRVLSNGDFLLLTYPIESHVDLTGLGKYGANETMADCEIQEVDPKANLVWSWLASDHIDPRTESLEPTSSLVNGVPVVDIFHCNSIDVDPGGNLLVSARQTNALFYVNRSTGTIAWKLGGTASNKDGAQHLTVTGDPQGTFNEQHDARFLPSGDVTMFDDHGAKPGQGVARGVEYSLDHSGGTATFVWQSLGAAQSLAEGSFRRYADGHSVIGWGATPPPGLILTEVDVAGTDVLDIGSKNGPSYRSIKVPLSQLNIDVLRATVGAPSISVP